MIKPTPNPPNTDPNSPKLDQAAKRTIDAYLKPTEPAADPAQLFTVVDGIDTECLLVNLNETLNSASAMIDDLTFDLEGSRRHVMLGIQQLIELSSLLANRALDNVDPR